MSIVLHNGNVLDYALDFHKIYQYTNVQTDWYIEWLYMCGQTS